MAREALCVTSMCDYLKLGLHDLRKADTSAEASECVNQHADIRLAIVRRIRHGISTNKDSTDSLGATSVLWKVGVAPALLLDKKLYISDVFGVSLVTHP